MNKKKLAVIIPVFNEGRIIINLLNKWLRVISYKNKKNFKLIVINDGSTDDTHKKLKKIKNKSIVYIKQKNIGHGNTCIKGYKIAIKQKYQIILQIDSDNQCDPKYFMNFLSQINKVDAVFGYRKKREDGIIRLLFSRILSILIFLKVFVYVKDANVPYRMMKRKVLEKTIKKIPDAVILKNAYLSYLIQKEFSIKWINISFKKRLFGKTNYNFKGLFFMILNLLSNIK